MENPARQQITLCDILINMKVVQAGRYTIYRSPITENLDDFDLNLQGHSKSNVTVPLDSPFMILYSYLKVTYGITRLLYDI